MEKFDPKDPGQSSRVINIIWILAVIFIVLGRVDKPEFGYVFSIIMTIILAGAYNTLNIGRLAKRIKVLEEASENTN